MLGLKSTTTAAGRAPASRARRNKKKVAGAEPWATARLTAPWPDRAAITLGIIPCLTRLSPRHRTARPGASSRAACAASRQLRLVGSEKSRTSRATKASIATTRAIIPSNPHGTARRRPAGAEADPGRDGFRTGPDEDMPRQPSLAYFEEHGGDRSAVFSPSDQAQTRPEVSRCRLGPEGRCRSRQSW